MVQAAMIAGVAVAVLIVGSTAQILQTAAPAPQAAIPSAGSCMSGQPAGQLTNAGTGTISVASDVATVPISISATRPTASAAREDAATSATAVIAAVRQIAGIAADNVQSTSLSLYPITSSDSGNASSTPEITGYQFTNSIQVTINNVTGDLLANVTDSAIRAGGDDVSLGGISFSLSGPAQSQALQQARIEATKDATNTAALFASQLGVSLGHIVTFSEAAPDISVPVDYSRSTNTQVASFAAASTSTPVNLGKQTVSTTVTITYATC